MKHRKLIRKVLCFFGLHKFKSLWDSQNRSTFTKKCLWCGEHKGIE